MLCDRGNRTKSPREYRNSGKIDRRSLRTFIPIIGRPFVTLYCKGMKIILQNAGVDCVKFQKTSLPEKFTKFALKKPYDSVNSWGSTYGEHKQYLEFSEEQFYHLQSYAKKRNVLFTATPKDIVSIRFPRGRSRM